MTSVESQKLADIAREHLNLTTLATRNADGLDFKEHSVWDIKAALEAAFAAGKASR